MVESYLQHDDTLQAFHKWRLSSAALLLGTGGPHFEAKCQFIPSSTLEEYFGRPHQVENLLKAVLNDEQRPAVDANYVRSHYLRTFATLLSIGEGHMIHHFQKYQSLRDEKLPHNTRPDDFPFTSPDKFEIFADAQRQFCASALEYSMNSRYKEKDILPIISKEKIGEGGSGIIYKIVVAEGYNSLRPHRQAIPFHPEHKNTFVLKTYRTEGAEENYKAERDAYMKLRWTGKPSPHIIAYYGGFIHGNSYNIILEYADRGTLESFMRTTDPPSTVEDTLLFWNRIFGIIDGLINIHGRIGAASSASQFLNGCHQDIKPANIFVFTGTENSPYDCQFKIGDLGLTHFRPSNSGPNDPLDLDVFGTRAYGAPETLRSYPETEAAPLQITSAVDIWSIGCVLSEAAVWAHYGWRKVDEYRRQRSVEIKDKGGEEGEHLFHYGGSLLDTVDNIHEEIQRKSETKSHMTRSVLDRLVVSDMLLHEDRPQAKFLFDKSKRLINQAAKQFGVPTDWLAGNTNGELVETNGASHLQSVPSRGVTKATIERYKGSRGERGLPLKEPYPPDNDSAPPSPSSESQPSPRTQHHKSASQGSRRDSNHAIVTSQPGGQASHIGSSPSPRSVGAKTDKLSAVQHVQQPQEELERPVLTLDQGHEWKKKKKNHEYTELPGAENLTTLNKRDHIFLIDNSATMKQYSKDIANVVSLLAYMLKDLDKDGLDIYFTQSLKMVNSDKSKKLVTSIYQEPFRGVTNMGGRLKQIMKEHIEKFGTSIQPPKLPFRSQPPPISQRPLSFYVLTDAKWQPTDVGGFIKNIVHTMKEKNCAKEHVAIQFIRFGDDQASIDKLDELDSGLGLKAMGMYVASGPACTFE
ncbi:hypothetical protein MMC18_004684 [Xylographa bjoerkii]|nr:hypothetical protein [Xylographa bjoerkii]